MDGGKHITAAEICSMMSVKYYKFLELRRSGWLPPPDHLRIRLDGRHEQMFVRDDVERAIDKYKDALILDRQFALRRRLLYLLEKGASSPGALGNQSQTVRAVAKEALDNLVEAGLVTVKINLYSLAPLPLSDEARRVLSNIESTKVRGATGPWYGCGLPESQLTVKRDAGSPTEINFELNRYEMQKAKRLPPHSMKYYGPRSGVGDWKRQNVILRLRNELYFKEFPERLTIEWPNFWDDMTWKTGPVDSQKREQLSVDENRDGPVATPEVSVPSRKAPPESDKEIGPNDVLNLSPESAGSVEVSRPKSRRLE